MKRLSILLTLLLAFSVLIGGQGFLVPIARADAGSIPPEEAGWVLISTAAQLEHINQNQPSYVGRSIRLMNDIDMTGYDWIPFGGNENPAFSGTFDGRGHRISGISIHDVARTDVGFFGIVSGTIRNLSLSVEAEGGSSTGGLVGRLNGGRVILSSTQGTVTGGNSSDTGVSSVGGLVGVAVNSAIERSHSSASVKSGSAGNQFAGGLVGAQGTGIISNAYATGTVTNASNPGIFFTAGGLAAQLIYGTIESSYAAGALTLSASVSYVIAGGFAGSLITEASIIDSYFDNVTTQQTKGVADYSSGGSVQLAGRATADMRQQSNYEGWDFADTWTVHPAVNGGYPYFRPIFLTNDLPRATKETPYSLTLEAVDSAAGGLSWSASPLPAGMRLTGSGTLEGTPELAGAFPITVTATDAGLRTANALMTLYVDEFAPDIAGFSIVPGRLFGSTKVTATPGNPDHTFAYRFGGSAGVRPFVGVPLPGGTIPYSLGTDIPAAAAGQTLEVYELDAGQTVRAWSSARLEAAHIQDKVFVTGVSLHPSELALTAGQAPQKLTATVQPADATNPAVTWSTSNPDAASVDSAGTVTPIAAGIAIVTATTVDGAFTAHATVTVQPVPPTTGTVTGTVYGIGNVPLSGAAVMANGMSGMTDRHGNFTLTGVAAGTHTLTISAPGYDVYITSVNVISGQTAQLGRIDLTLTPVPVTGVSLHPTELILTAGQAPQKLTATVQPADATNPAVTWLSSNPAIASVDSAGTVTPVAEGTATVTVTTVDGSYNAHATVTVQPVPPTTGTVTGTVYGIGDAPIDGATASANGMSGTTDGYGKFIIGNIAPGAHTLTLTAPGYNDYMTSVTVVAGQIVDSGRFDLTALDTEEPSDHSDSVQSTGQVPAPDPETMMTITINGQDVRVVMAKEQASDGRAVLRLMLDGKLLNTLFAGSEAADLELNSAEPIVKVDLPAAALQALADRHPNAVIRISASGASYSLPLHLWLSVPIDAVATVAIARINDTDGDELAASLNQQGYTMLAEPVDFSLYIDGNDMTDTGSVYIMRTIPLDAPVLPDRSTVVWIDGAGRPHFIPSVFRTVDPQPEAVFYAPHHSLYTAIRSNRTFEDVKGHWAQADIELLANKLVVQGTDQNIFVPDRTVTRAEFAAMLIRALGLDEKPGYTLYSDVSPEKDWYSGAVGAASKAGVIEGYADGTFKPNAPITREQITVMLSRVLQFAGKLRETDEAALDRFADHAVVADWAKQPAAQLLAANVIEGVTDTTFAPQALATRAQCSALLKRMLHYLKFID
ncbi:hypothetical protein PAESOLCIP111_05960 [Paenibacillus solanacearum]|uniref:SLH domain-containing protein n=1 Tax=Paenibacillus solanacearum TaxID=2048548 RepID=A0A916K9R4_9BACL|nr:S-layer homology domain-containing protein [Paenibacillus solanacearum]CAG7649828.1 hypothetical protein PAESOLCIP111_05960 [Paenibacillus solanacearum]